MTKGEELFHMHHDICENLTFPVDVGILGKNIFMAKYWCKKW